MIYSSFMRLREAIVLQVDQVPASILPAGEQVWE